jgi:hypothetical protein
VDLARACGLELSLDISLHIVLDCLQTARIAIAVAARKTALRLPVILLAGRPVGSAQAIQHQYCWYIASLRCPDRRQYPDTPRGTTLYYYSTSVLL